MPQVQKRATAKRDLVEHYVYLGEQAGIDTAERFLLQADESFSDLARHPQMGVCPDRDPAGTRRHSQMAGERL